MKQYAELDDTVYFWFPANDTSGSGGDGANPAADVRLAGASAGAAPVISPTPVLLSHASYPAGCYEVAIVATSGNGFAAGQTYAVFSTLLIDGQNPTGLIGAFDLKPVLADAEDSVCDALLTGSSHNTPTSLGRRLREIAAFAIHSGTAQAGGVCSITLSDTASGSDGVYNRNLVVIVEGAGIGQTRTIVDYDGVTKVAVVDRDWRIQPDNVTEYQVVPDDTPLTVDHGVARGGTLKTITIREYASSVDDAYLCNIITIIAGTGRGQARLVGSYDGSSKIVTVCGDDWVTAPNDTSIYVMMPYGVTCVSCMNDNALNQVKAQCEAAITDFGPPTRSEATEDKDEIIAVLGDLNNISVADIIAGVVDGSYDFQEMMRLIFAACCGKSSGGGTTTLKFRDSADSKDRITATVSEDNTGNRIDVVLDGL